MPGKEFAHAVLMVSGAYVLQLRDNIPGIAYPGISVAVWGSLEPNEEPAHGLRREILEELEIALDGCRLLWKVDTFSQFWPTGPPLVLRRRRDRPVAVARRS